MEGVVGKVSDVEDESVVVEVVVVDVDGKPGCTGNGDDPFCALLVFPEVDGEVAAIGDAAAAVAAGAAEGQADAWLEEGDVVAVACCCRSCCSNNNSLP